MALPQPQQADINRIPTEFPLIDSDPHFQRVVRFFRPSDWAWTVASPFGGVGFLYLYDWTFPQRLKPAAWRSSRAQCAFYGLVGIFFWRYQQVSHRFWGKSENAREQAKDLAEMRQRIADGQPLYGNSRLSDYTQGVAHGHSKGSADMLWLYPWFNFANHKYHSTDQDYYAGALADRRPADYQKMWNTYA